MFMQMLYSIRDVHKGGIKEEEFSEVSLTQGWHRGGEFSEVSLTQCAQGWNQGGGVLRG